jgi:hypothetical protein
MPLFFNERRTTVFSRKFVLVVIVVFAITLLAAAPAMAREGLFQVDTNSSDGCKGSWTFPPLYVGGDDGAVFAQAVYEFDKNCKPVLVSQVRLSYVPDSVLKGQKPVEIKTASIIPPSPPKGDGFGIDSVDTCHLRTWEEDAPGLDMIAVQIDQSYSWNGSTVTLSNGTVSASTYFSWWHISSGPYGVAGYRTPQVAYSNGWASFYCNGGPFCSGGSSYYITLYDYMTVDSQGGCGGYGTYSGTVVPYGRVRYSVWK